MPQYPLNDVSINYVTALFVDSDNEVYFVDRNKSGVYDGFRKFSQAILFSYPEFKQMVDEVKPNQFLVIRIEKKPDIKGWNISVLKTASLSDETILTEIPREDLLEIFNRELPNF